MLQRSLVKVSFLSHARPGGFRAYGQYLGRKGAQRESERGIGFDADREDVHLPDRLDDWQRAGDRRLWKIVVSPEAGDRVDLHAHARALVRAVEGDLDVELDWAAIDHHDTDHPHVHVVIRGVDRSGRELRFPRAYVREGIRARSQEVLTRTLGLRQDRERLTARERAIEAPRVTEIDRGLLRRATADGRVAAPASGREGMASGLFPQELRRLLYLRSLGLAEHLSKHEWQLDANLEAKLRELQIAGDVQKSMWRGGVGITDARAPVVVTTLAPGQEIRGRVAGAGYSETSDGTLLVVEATDGRRHILREEQAISSSRAAGVLRPGSVATIRRAPLGGTQVLAHGRIGDLQRVDTPSTALDLDALEWLRSGQPERAEGARPRGFQARWWHAVRDRLPLLERAGLIRRHGLGEAQRLIVIQGAEREVEKQSNEREHSRLRVAEVEPRFGKPARPASETPALSHEGRLVAYAVDEREALHAVIDTGRQLTVVPVVERSVPIGHDTRAHAQIQQDDQRRRVTWTLDDLERMHEHSRSR